MSLYVDIEKKLGSFTLSMKLETGEETLALLGASGCGKSMTLKCIAGIEHPDRGRIVVDGVTFFDSEKKINLSPQERRTGFLFQNYALFPNMTVWQNVMCGAVREKDKAARRERAEAILDSFGLKELKNRYPSRLSGGQQQRAALARILVSEPRILLLDEPFSALDSHLRFRLEQEVRAVIRSFGKTVVLVSHDRDEVFRMADQVAILKDGRVENQGTKMDVFAAPGTVSAAMLTGCKNISRIEKITERRVRALDWGVELELPREAGAAEFVGIRMHDVVFGPGANKVFCDLVEEIENPFSFVAMLSPAGTVCQTPFGWETDKAIWRERRAERLTVHLPPEKLLLLRG